MKYSILGFYQKAVLEVTKEVMVEQKAGEYPKYKTIKLDCIDLLILQDVADFMNRKKIIKYTIDDKIYFSIHYSAIIEDLPILGIKQQALSDRLSKLVELDLLEKAVIKNQAGSFVAFRLGEKYEHLKYTPNEREFGTSIELPLQTYQTTSAKVADYTPKYSSTNNSSTKEEIDTSISKKDTINYTEILLQWKKINPNLKQPRMIDEKRKKAIRTLLKNNNATIEDLYRAFQMISISSFCNANHERNRKWEATFDWLIKDTNGCFNRLLEGQFALTDAENTLAEKITNGEWDESFSSKITSSSYHPYGNTSIMYDENSHRYIYTAYSFSMIADGYTDDERPDGAVLVLNSGRGTLTWSKAERRWIHKK